MPFDRRILYCILTISFVIRFFHPTELTAQFDGILYDDEIYSGDIHSIKFHLTGFPLTQPIIDLGSEATLELIFDDLNREMKDYYYTIIHCDQDWTPSDLNVFEYLDGFDEEQIRDVDFSFNTLTEYTNYRLTIPNQNVGWTKSGNYILVVYLNEDQKELAFTRRFMVVEPLVRISPQMVRPAKVSKSRTHQEIDFKVSFEKLRVRDPRKELKATVLQNGRWDNAIQGLSPVFLYPNEVVFDYQDKITFPAGKEFRFIDLRSFRYRSEGVAEIKEFRDIYEVNLYTEEDRAFTPYSFHRDINGNFTIENVHEEDNDLESDYASVLFSYRKTLPFENADLYLFGKMTDWKIKDKFKMAYSQSAQVYITEVLLKQGYYNYAYLLVPKGKEPANLTEIEGDWFESENEYTIFVYFRSFGERYDRLIGGVTFNSNL